MQVCNQLELGPKLFQTRRLPRHTTNPRPEHQADLSIYNPGSPPPKTPNQQAPLLLLRFQPSLCVARANQPLLVLFASPNFCSLPSAPSFAVMTKQTAFSAAEDALAAAPAQLHPGRRFTSFPPPSRARGGCRKAAAAQALMDHHHHGAARTAAGSWLDSMVKASTSPRRAELDDWMVRRSRVRKPRVTVFNEFDPTDPGG